MQKMTAEEARARLADLPKWELADNAIRRQYTFSGFADAVAFVVRVGFSAEAADHHPDIHIGYKRVTLVYSTHSAGGLTDKDFLGASEADRLAGTAS